MATASTLVKTNMAPGECIRDVRGGGRDPNFYCLPPSFFKEDGKRRLKAKHRFYLVTQGHRVGVYDEWLLAKASISGYPDASYRGCDSIEECVEAWQALCPLGVHPHPVDPHAGVPIDGSASEVLPAAAPKVARPASQRRAVKEEGTSARTKARGAGSAPPSPEKRARSGGKGPLMNFAIRGDGVVSSSAARSHQRYRELQSAGEEPDLLITRDLLEASFFAVEDDDDESSVSA